MTDVIVHPYLFESLEAGNKAVIDSWRVSEGELVHAGQILAQALLAHQYIDVDAPHAGVLEEILIGAGEHFDRGDVLARVVNL